MLLETQKDGKKMFSVPIIISLRLNIIDYNSRAESITDPNDFSDGFLIAILAQIHQNFSGADPRESVIVFQ